MGAWTAVDWRVKEEHAEEFPRQWEEMMRHAKEQIGLLEWARLVRDADDPTHYVSFGSWKDDGPRTAVAQPEFLALLEGCEAMCREVTGGPGHEVVLV